MECQTIGKTSMACFVETAIISADGGIAKMSHYDRKALPLTLYIQLTGKKYKRGPWAAGQLANENQSAWSRLLLCTL